MNETIKVNFDEFEKIIENLINNQQKPKTDLQLGENETAVEVVPLKIKAKCEKCEGYYIHDIDENGCSIILTSSPPQFPHKCTKCSDTKTFFEKYPKIIFKEKNI